MPVENPVQVDDIEVAAFFPPPSATAGTLRPEDLSLIVLAILCDLAAEVRPLKVNFRNHGPEADVLKVLLTRVPRAYCEFSSCGPSTMRSKHCGECVKCALVYALLLASDSGRPLAGRIFRRDLLEDVEFTGRGWTKDP